MRLLLLAFLLCHPTAVRIRASGTPPTPSAAQPLWSFQPLKLDPPPAVRDPGWCRTSIDPFLLAALESQGLKPAPPASRRALIRRITFDLTGLPPAPEEVAAFEADASTNALAKVVDRLLASPHYGEQWGRHWLDLVRYADTAGDTADYPAPLAWRYRNYVVEAFNRDKPYREFLREQLAGDLLATQGPPDRYAERVTATGFLAISRRFGFDSENYHHLTLQDTIDTVGQVILGLSLGCARCHDHKFDPVTMRDYYALYGIFDSTRYAFPGSEQKGKLRAMVPLVPVAESQPRWREFDRKVASLSGMIARARHPVPTALLRSLHDPDGDFEIQKDAAGGSYGVLVPPWIWEGKLSATTSAQSPFKNLYPAGRFGASIAGGDREYRLAQQLHPARRAPECPTLHFNLDFRLAPTPDTPAGPHRLWMGESDGTPALVLRIGSDRLFLEQAGGVEPLAALSPHQWHNLQLELNLADRSFTGTLATPDLRIPIPRHPLSSRWSGVLDHFQADSQARGTNSLAGLELDNFGLQPEAILPATTSPPAAPARGEEIDPAALEKEIQEIVGLDGALEWQTEDSAPVRPWNPGPNSLVKVLPGAQSPFQNIYPSGHLGLALPGRAEYDGFGLTLPIPWTETRTEHLHWSVDFRCGTNSPVRPAGSWRCHLGHGGGGPGAVELFIDEAHLYATVEGKPERVADLTPGRWHQVQLHLNLREKRYSGTLATPAGSTRFEGALMKGWDGTIDYCYIDSEGHRAGVRPSLDADNMTVSENPLPPLDGPAQPAAEDRRRDQKARLGRLRGQLAALPSRVDEEAHQLIQLLEEGPCPLAYGVVEGTPHDARVQQRGEPDRPGELIPRGFIRALGGSELQAPARGSGRLELADWLTRDNPPLAARVLVNRVWQHHFGAGLVTTPNDFGRRGQPPANPALLEFLTAEFIRGGGSIKRLHRLILLSASYALSTDDDARDPGPPPAGRLRHFQRRRLTGEEVRDAILLVSGELDPTMPEGHAFPSPVTASYSQHGPFTGVYDHNHRSLYLMTQRLKRHPFLALFDGADPNATTPERRTTTVPTQALYFLNSPFVHEKSEKCARRLERASPDDREAQIDLLWRLAAGRHASREEQAEAALFLAAYHAGLPSGTDPERATAALAAYVRSVFGSNEFLHID